MVFESDPRERECVFTSLSALSVKSFEMASSITMIKLLKRSDFLNRTSNENFRRASFNGGAIGFVGYDDWPLREYWFHSEDTIGQQSDLHFFLYESYVIFDHKKEKV